MHIERLVDEEIREPMHDLMYALCEMKGRDFFPGVPRIPAVIQEHLSYHWVLKAAVADRPGYVFVYAENADGS